MRRRAAEKQGSGGTGSGLLKREVAVHGRNAGHGRELSALGSLGEGVKGME